MTFEEVQIGTPLGPERVCVSKEQARRCARAFGLDMPRFTDDEAAREEGLGGMILPGNTSLALLTRLVTDWIGSSNARLVRLGTTYRVLVEPERMLTLSGFVTHTYPAERRCEIDLWIEDEDSERIVTGTATVEFAH
jgi:acyl dehydratase